MSDRRRLFLSSFLMLFVELVLIRWAGANLIHLSFFSNFVLLGSFLGIGLGFLIAGRSFDLFRWSPIVLVAFLAFVVVVPAQIGGTGSDFVFFNALETKGLPIWVVLPIVFVSVALAMCAIAQGVGRLFARFEPLTAYRLDILGSLSGIVVFAAMSLLGATPLVWGVVIALAYVPLLVPQGLRMLDVIALLGIVAVLAPSSLRSDTIWSPYYRIETGLIGQGRIEAVWVNGIPHQGIMSTNTRREVEPEYFLPYGYRAAGPPRDVLIVGAGNGTDVAIALEEGSESVRAVEIDRSLQQLGVERQPDRPYQDERVHVTIDDGRAFLERTSERYDLILFALPDSLTLVAGQSSLRLESYLFTRQAIEAARERLTSDGVFAMYNYYREPWLADRFANTLQEVFGHPPCFDSKGVDAHLAVMTIGLEPADVDCPEIWTVLDAPVSAPATDDHPFPYLRRAGLPALYAITLSLILVASFVGVRVVAGPLGPMSRFADLFFMGVAFLLLETMHVVRFALLFGTTWFVNALVFAAILGTVLIAIEVARRWRPRHPLRLYGVLLGAIAVAWLVPPHLLLDLAPPARFVVAGMLAFAPVFLANLVFAERFRDVEEPTIAFGANLLGAMVGGVLEYASLLVGYRALLVVASVAYALAFITGRRALERPVVGTLGASVGATQGSVSPPPVVDA
jgi:SAM-dependent methyltransferase